MSPVGGGVKYVIHTEPGPGTLAWLGWLAVCADLPRIIVVALIMLARAQYN